VSLRLTVLGGAAAWPNPDQGCSSYLVESAATSLLLDCGPNTIMALRERIDYHDLDAVVISHWHSDHILDLIPYRYGLTYGPGDVPAPIPLWLPTGGPERLAGIAAAISGSDEDPSVFWNRVFDLREYEPDDVLEIGDLRVSFAVTQHPLPCRAIRVDHRSGASIAYSADTGAIEPLVELFRGVDVALVEATLDEYGPKPPTHLTPEDAGRLAEVANAGRLILTHLWSERPANRVIARARTAYAGPTQVATRGLIVDV